MNNSNSLLFQNFLRVANTVHTGLLQKYHDGEFSDPALYDPKADK
jgi:hypothetical protein